MITMVVLGVVALVVVVEWPSLRRTPTRTRPNDRRDVVATGWFRRQTEHATRGGLADLVLLLAVGLLSGLSVSLTCRQIARTVASAEASMLAAVVERQRRGQPLLDALTDVALGQPPSDEAPPLDAEPQAGTQATAADAAGMARTIALLRSQVEDGAAVADALLELSTTLRNDARRLAETRARRLPVRMLLPLIVCVLPGFLCLTVAPVIIESLRSVAI